ncbi:uncharacterized protein MYCFIDRAFT_212038 [Pseudocercospora fijiensis CIRAD86]|uniref:L-serine ammonia-lyase n=1 Tax=Pseudocercospora fijiensis (strain CIRAD86) TaxID=383855 RepID=M2YRK5_PSEFD|nr:uncharacterized protein MYCFIDRAFT_212038 [Pseudocercospora fijiensis CIRAD86]EME80345.1 hypothetical protein MYCFIDRAFT_212038 [Pseudocercospora fijiensis CIRAD86]
MAVGAKTSHRTRYEKKPWRKTPLVESTKLSEAAGCRIFLKLENLQPSGSFKSRGLGNLVLKTFYSSPEPHKLHIFSSSGGNAGLGAVYAANFVGRPSTVCVPMSTKPHMIEKIKAAGATEVIQHGPTLHAADVYLKEVVMPAARMRGEVPLYVNPFDHPDIWQGHSSLVDEVSEQMAEIGEQEEGPELMVCSVGGGGLFNGIMEGIERQIGKGEGRGWEATQVLCVETEGADSLAQSLASGENTTLKGITSIATSLGVVRVSDRTFELVREGRETGKVKNVVLSDAEAAMGCWRLAEDERILVEAACGVNVALCYGNRLKKALGRPVRPDEKVVLVICGGSNVSTSIVEGWKEEYAGVLETTIY